MDLAEGWAEVIATRDAAPADCPCRAVTAPLIDAWLARDRNGLSDDQHWSNLRAAQTAQRAPGALAAEAGDVTIDVRTPTEVAKRPREGAVNIPVDELMDRLAEVPLRARVVVYCASGARARRAVHLLRGRGYYACNGHEAFCELPALHGMSARLGWKDPKMAGSPLDALAGMFTDATSAFGGQAARSTVTAASDEAKGQIPGLVDAFKAQIPGVVGAAANAARPFAHDIAGEAGKAAGKGAREGAIGGGQTSALPVILGALVVVGAAVSIGYAAHGRKGNK
jgi:rhodanese-related sulfurtransferase